MKLYCFDVKFDEWPIENATVIAENEEQAWALFRDKYNKLLKRHDETVDGLKEEFEVLKVYTVNKPAAWLGWCSN